MPISRKERCRRMTPSPLLVVFLVSTASLCFGTIVAIYDIERYGAGLYLCLVSVVTVVVALAFCLVGTDEQTEPTMAKKVWSTTRQTIRRYARSKAEPSRVEIKIANIDISEEENEEEDEEEDDETGTTPSEPKIKPRSKKRITIREPVESGASTDPSLPSCSSVTIQPSQIIEKTFQIDETSDYLQNTEESV